MKVFTGLPSSVRWFQDYVHMEKYTQLHIRFFHFTRQCKLKKCSQEQVMAKHKPGLSKCARFKSTSVSLQQLESSVRQMKSVENLLAILIFL